VCVCVCVCACACIFGVLLLLLCVCVCVVCFSWFCSAASFHCNLLNGVAVPCSFINVMALVAWGSASCVTV
jgi:hypothetical protein